MVVVVTLVIALLVVLAVTLVAPVVGKGGNKERWPAGTTILSLADMNDSNVTEPIH